MARGSEEASDLHQKLEEVRQPPPRVRPVPALVPRPPQTSLVKFVGNIYTLKCWYAALPWGREGDCPPRAGPPEPLGQTGVWLDPG